MPVQFKEWSDDSFNVFLDYLKHTAKLAAERVVLMNAASPDSADFRIHRDYLQSELAPTIGELGSIACGFIKSYNDHPENFQLYTRNHALKAELAVDEVTSILREAGIIVNFLTN